jgi:uncharacterized repeat protein (TIGR01451 family)
VTDTSSATTQQLQISKLVKNVTQGGSFVLSNQAKSGDVLEYQITYTNLGATAISGLSIADYVSTNASFDSATADALPASLTACAMNTPKYPAALPATPCSVTQGTTGSGPVTWTFTGTLAPNSSSTVRFSVKVN